MVKPTMKRIHPLILAAAALLSVAALVIEPRLTSNSRSPHYETMVRAASLMAEAEQLISQKRLDLGLSIDRAHDPNGTGLIGIEYSGTTTSLGDLEAKRTTTSPDMAAVMVGLLLEAGVQPGDSIALGASGSFPGAVLATLAAARAMDLQLAIIVSLGSSTWGANVPGFSLLAMLQAAESVTGYEALAFSLGGDGDHGGGMDPEARDQLLAELYDSGQRVIAGRSLADSVAERMSLYDYASYEAPFRAFVNIGGASANTGVGMTSLSLVPGVNTRIPSPSADDSGVIFEMGKRGIPVIHVLNLKRLALDRGLAWDPVPFPAIGKARVYLVRDEATYRRSLLWLVSGYAAMLAILAFVGMRLAKPGTNPKDGRQEPPQP